jgi:hypothetical protein
MLKSIFAASVISFSLATAALSTTVTNVTPNLTTLAPNSLVLPDGGTWFVAPNIVSGSVGGAYRSPFEDLGTGNFEDISYWNAAGTGTGTYAQLLLSSARSTLSFLWGSPDAYNFVTLINRATDAVLVVGLDDLTNPPVGDSATFVTIAGFMFDKVEFFSSSPALEFANVAAVPLPAGALLLIGALGGLMVLRRRSIG